MGPATPLPSGTITFLLTDIEGSTRLWEQHPEAMAAALARHDALAAALIADQGGSLLKSRGEGDSLFAVFPDPTEALAAALALQRAFHDEPWPRDVLLRVRVALHTGDAAVREGDYFGPAVNRCARLRAAAHGGQVLLSQAVCEAVRDRLPDGVALRDLGSHRLKDLQQPERIYQLLHAALPAEFPPLRSLEAFRHNLPAQLTSFIGREQQMVEVERLLGSARLLTLTGTGGCGKTRLALQVAADQVEAYSDGVWFVQLASLADPALVPQTVAAALGVREEPGRRLTATLVDYLRGREALLLVDNCEHLLTAAAELAEELLRDCPRLQILATSREGLGILGEQTYRIPSLSMPVTGGVGPEALLEYEAAQLFVERARLIQPVFAVTAGNAAAVAEVCERLDGIPLAIELAAARLKALSVEQLAARLEDRFRLLTGGSRTALPRQQTLRALIDWSYDLLSAAERALLHRLSVFASGWTLAAAEAVCAGDGIEEWDVLDLLTALVEKSLVAVEQQGAEIRYRFLETVRQYACDRLLDVGGAENVRSRHQEWFLALAEQAEPELLGANQEIWFGRLDAEHDNIRAALAWALEVDPASALRLAGALWRFWEVRGCCTEGRVALERALERGGDTPAEVRARGLVWAGVVTFEQGDLEAAEPLLVEGLALSRAHDHQKFVAWSLHLLGVVALGRGDLEGARCLFVESLAIQRRIGDRWGISTSVLYLAGVAWARGDVPSARSLYEEGLQLKQEIGDHRGIAVALTCLGQVARVEGNPTAASGYYREALSIRRRIGDHLVASSLSNLGWTALEQGEVEEARASFEGALTFLRRVEIKGAAIETIYAAEALRGLGCVARAEGDWQRARALLKESLTLRRERGNAPDIPAGLEALAHVVGAERTARLLGAAGALREATGTPRPPADRAECDRTAAAARAALGEEAFAAAWAVGRGMTPEQAVELALAACDADREGEA